MKTLILARHANAETNSGFYNDSERKLSEKGKKDAASVSEYFCGNFCLPDIFISSDAVRAKETAGIFCQNFENKSIIKPQYRREIYSNDPNSLLYVISQTNDAYERLMILGHNPSISQIACYLCRTNTFMLPTSSIISLRFDDCSSWKDIINATAQAECYLTPENLIKRDKTK